MEALGEERLPLVDPTYVTEQRGPRVVVAVDARRLEVVPRGPV